MEQIEDDNRITEEVESVKRSITMATNEKIEVFNV